jgi:molybdenum cofactor cytidylyltransferase
LSLTKAEKRNLLMNSPTRRIAAVILAAGSSQRMQSRKQLLLIEGETMVHRALRTALEADFDFVIAAIKSGDEEITQALSGLDFEIAPVENPQLGQSESIRAGLEIAAKRGCDAILFMPCDLPLLTTKHLNALISHYKTGTSAIVASRYDGIVGTPLILDNSLWNELRELRGDIGARKIVSRHSDQTFLIDWEGGKFDLDTPADLEIYLSQKPVL